MSLEYDVGTNLGIGFFNPAQSKEMWFRRFNSVAISLLTTTFMYMYKGCGGWATGRLKSIAWLQATARASLAAAAVAAEHSTMSSMVTTHHDESHAARAGDGL